MREISINEFKKNFDKYLELCQSEKIYIINRGKIVAVLYSGREEIANNMSKLFGTLPKEAYDDKDINRE